LQVLKLQISTSPTACLALALMPVSRLDRLDAESVEGLAHARRVVEAQDELALQAGEEARKARESSRLNTPSPWCFSLPQYGEST